ncbi:hypothetical protein DFR31_2257 [Alkalispirillum mobile]|uniref:Uncharacterized protein n=1 Tax=Alkalispirillum mobile TaxID=85925 RepID=A0A498C758_9GAMM|nr:hypothetical protein [Alkalispirillum mobile]RLK48378.1 hypothetical protein DFR31_2257 [Alkalispirillum mobile]
MNLLDQTKQFAAWFTRLNKACLTNQPAWFLISVFSTVVSDTAKLLAFILPLKVVLLAGSEGVPRYFEFFIDSAFKDNWILGLSIAAILCYILHLGLDTLVERMAHAGGHSVASSANKLALVRGQEEIAKKYFSRVTSLSASTIFLFLALSGIAVMRPDLITPLGFVSLLLFCITTGWLALERDRQPTWIQRNTKLYSSIITSSIFLAGFLFIVYPYTLGTGPNILFSLVAIVLLKRGTKTLNKIIIGSVGLTADRPFIDPLMFRSGKIPSTKDVPAESALRDLFQKRQRETNVREHLPEQYDDYSLDVRWDDNRLRGIYSLRIIATPPCLEEKPQLLRGHIFSPQRRHLMEREDYLFQHVPRDALLAASPVTSFQVEDFTCHIIDYETGKRYSPRRWNKAAIGILGQLWSVEPPKALIKAYKLSHPMLWHRLTTSLINRTRIAAETVNEEQTLDQFLNDLEATYEKLLNMPLYLDNSDLHRGNVVQRTLHNAQCTILFWGRWSVEPIGYCLPRQYAREELGLALEHAKQTRRRIPDSFSMNDLLWVNSLAAIEKAINRENYRAALKQIISLYNPTPT